MTVLPYAVAILQLGAGLVYFYHVEWRLGLVWFALGVANTAFAGIK